MAGTGVMPLRQGTGTLAALHCAPTRTLRCVSSSAVLCRAFTRRSTDYGRLRSSLWSGSRGSSVGFATNELLAVLLNSLSPSGTIKAGDQLRTSAVSSQLANCLRT